MRKVWHTVGISFFSLLRRQWFLLSAVGIVLLPLIVFGHSLFQDFAAIDDSFLIVNNPIVHGWDIRRIWLAFTTFDPELYIPFTLVSFQLNWILANGAAWPFHATNLLLHSANALLVTLLVLSLTRHKITAIVVGLLFAVHPLHTEAVVWAAGRKDLLCTTFLLLSYLLFRHWKIQGRSTALIASIVFFLCSLLSKVLSATLPAVLVIDLLLLDRHQRSKKKWWSLAPFMLLSIGLLIVARFGKEHILASSTLWETFVMAQKSSMFYLQKLLVPLGLTVIYPFQETISLQRAEFLLPTLCNIVLLIAAFWQRHKRPLVTFGILFYFLTLSPTFFNFHKGDLLFFAVDRYAYIPSIGIFLAATVLIGAVIKTWALPRNVAAVAACCVLSLLSVLSFRQTYVWDSPDTLFGRSVRLYPQSVAARMALASVLRERNDLTGAFDILKEGLRYSDHPGLNLEAGLVYMASGQTEDAREQFEAARMKEPSIATSYFYLGFLDDYDKKTDNAIAHYTKAVALDPSYVSARVSLARHLIRRKQFADARSQLLQALTWNPVSTETLSALTELAHAQGRKDEATQWQQTLEWVSR